MSNYWLVRAGVGGEFVSQFVEHSYVAVQFYLNKSISELAENPDLHESLKAEMHEASPELTPVQLGLSAGSLKRFYEDLSVGDIVVTPDSYGWRAHFGKVAGDYAFVPNPSDGCSFPHRRSVKWIKHAEWEDVPLELRKKFLAWITIVDLGPVGPLIDGFLQDVTPPTRRISVHKRILSRLASVDPFDFQEFVAQLLGAMGFQQTHTRGKGPDGNIDVEGLLDVEGILAISVVVQVKRYKPGSSIGIAEVQHLRGTLQHDQIGILITTGHFTRQAIEDAERLGATPIGLVDGRQLADLTLSYYDSLPDEFRELLGVRRIDVPLVEQFWAIESPEENAPPLSNT